MSRIAWQDLVFDAERAVLRAARRLRGSIEKRGPSNVPAATWTPFFKATDRLKKLHDDRKRKRITQALRRI